MKIVMFHYNRDASAVYRQNNDPCTGARRGNQLVSNCFLANGYADRLLWEEAASLKPKKTQEFAIPGNWQ
jgi:hypothetical protein